MAILSSAGYSIRIIIQPGGNLVEIYDSNTQKSIGGLNDLNHFSGARKFVADERKTTSSEEALEEQGAIILFLVDEIKKTDKAFVMPSVLSSEFCVFLKTTATKMAAVSENLQIIEDFKVEGTHKGVSKLVLVKMAALIMQTHISALTTFLKQGKLEKGFVNAELLKNGVPKWFVNKLEGQKIPTMQEPDINRVLYPQSAKSWVSLTLEEWRSDAVLANIEPLMQYSYWVRDFFLDDDKVKGFCGLETTVDLKDRSVPSVAKLFEAKANLVPHCMTYEYAFEPLSKGRDQGFWAVPRFDNPSNAIQSLSQAISRSILGFVSYSDVLDSFWAKLFPEISFDRSKISKANNIQKIALTAATDELRAAYSERLLVIEALDTRKAYASLICDQLHAGPGSSQRRFIEKHFGSSIYAADYKKNPKSGTSYKAPLDLAGLAKKASPTKLLNTLLDTNSSRERQGAIADILKTFPSKKGKVQQGTLVPRSMLGQKAQHFISKRLKRLRNHSLSKRMEIWFRAFQDERMQDAAVAQLEAQFDELFMGRLESAADSDGELSADEADDDDDT